MIGFRDRWRQSPQETRDYVSVIQHALEQRLSIAILRVQVTFSLVLLSMNTFSIMQFSHQNKCRILGHFLVKFYPDFYDQHLVAYPAKVPNEFATK